MGVNTEMHDCEPAMTQAQHFKLELQPFFPYPPSALSTGRLPTHFGLRELHAIHRFASAQL